MGQIIEQLTAGIMAKNIQAYWRVCLLVRVQIGSQLGTNLGTLPKVPSFFCYDTRQSRITSGNSDRFLEYF